MPLWLTLAIIVFIAARWIIYVIDRNVHMVTERIDAIGRMLESIEKSVKEAYRGARDQTEQTEPPTVSEETVRKWKDEAERGSPESQFSFGLHQSVSGLKTEAATWYRKAAEQGHAYAQNYLGMAYANYDGVPQDYSEAYFWLYLSATCWEKGKGNRDEVGKRLSDAERKEIEKRCQEWVESHPKIFR